LFEAAVFVFELLETPQQVEAVPTVIHEHEAVIRTLGNSSSGVVWRQHASFQSDCRLTMRRPRRTSKRFRRTPPSSIPRSAHSRQHTDTYAWQSDAARTPAPYNRNHDHGPHHEV
jgi:hypothetical protein